jgi:hypothetical protein
MAEKNQEQNKAVVPQIIGPVGGCDPIPWAPAVNLPASAENELDRLEKLIAEGYKEFAHLREYDHLE